jgi:hypothetical protein
LNVTATLLVAITITGAAMAVPAEIVGLRTAASRTLDNGDGTRTCEIWPAPDSVRIDSLSPSSSGTAYRYQIHGYWYYAVEEPGITYYADGYHPWVEFALGTVPDTAVVIAVSLLFYQYQHNGTPRTRLVNSHVDLLQSTPEGIYNWLSYGLSVTFSMNHAVDGWVEHSLNPTGLAVFDSCLESNYILLAIVPEGEGGGNAYGRGELYPPYLRVTYELAGVSESRLPDASRATRNATVIRGILNLQSPACNLQSDIALMDAAGRRVLSLHAGPNDVSDLAPGVYFVRSAAGVGRGASSVHKVIITE